MRNPRGRIKDCKDKALRFYGYVEGKDSVVVEILCLLMYNMMFKEVHITTV